MSSPNKWWDISRWIKTTFLKLNCHFWSYKKCSRRAAWRDKSNCWFSILLNGSISNSLVDLFRHPTSVPSYTDFYIPIYYAINFQLMKTQANVVHTESNLFQKMQKYILIYYISLLWYAYKINYKFLAHFKYNLKQCALCKEMKSVQGS